jgi:hypothetical protein
MEYLELYNLKNNFKLFNVDDSTVIPLNIKYVPTILDTTNESPIEGTEVFKYISNLKYFEHPTNNIEYWINKELPKPNIKEDDKAINNSNFAKFEKIEEIVEELVVKQKVLSRKQLLLKLKK